MNNLPDIVGSGVTAALASPNITARWIQAVVTGGGTVRIGGSNVSATLGLPVNPGYSQFFPPLPADGLSTSPYSLGGIYAYVPVGTTLSIAYGPFN